MRILMLTQVLPYPPVSGPQIKTYYTLRYLSRRHRITLVSFIRREEEEVLAQALRPYCEAVYTVRLRRSRWRDLRALVRALRRGEPFLIARDHVPAFYDRIRSLHAQEPFDAVHADQLNMAPYALALPIPRVLDAHNAVWRIPARLAQTARWLPIRWLAAWEARRLKAYEGAICRTFDAVLVVSAADREALEEAAGGPFRAVHVPIAIDPEDFPPVPRDPGAKGLLHIGGLYWPPNAEGIRWFLRAVWPRLRALEPEVELFLIGSRPPADIRRWAARDPHLHVLGFVPDPTPYWRRSAMLIVPLHAGSGVRVKILEAWSRGMPVVSTPIGCEGLAARPGENLLVAEDAPAFLEAIRSLLRDPARAARIGEAGRQTVWALYDYRKACWPLDEVYP